MKRATSLEKALEICEALSVSGRGLSVRELSRALGMPAPTVHRLLNVLKRRGYVRQDEETARYSLTLKMLDLSFRLMGRSELRLHAYPVIREHVLRTAQRAFFAVPSAGEVTYIWRAGPDEIGTYTAYGREMPGHCAMFFTGEGTTRRLTCVRMSQPRDAANADAALVRLGAPAIAPDPQRMLCTCAPVFDYTGREVARVGQFIHASDERAFSDAVPRAAWEVARLISLRLGYLPAATAAIA
ncbi:MAG TPA: helix-turn-helix domain-containing protein [Vicinamibacterales bacterium]|nr:helix-turn-helix domain-containing protein [Vicinamibacterales bacterium]